MIVDEILCNIWWGLDENLFVNAYIAGQIVVDTVDIGVKGNNYARITTKFQGTYPKATGKLWSVFERFVNTRAICTNMQ